MPKRMCSRPGCPGFAEIRGYCRTHATEQRKGNRSVNDAFYGSKAWKMSRKAQLFAHPLCEYRTGTGICGEIADSVHHITPIENGGAKRASQNLMSLCRPHHSAIHAQRNGGRVAK